MAVLIFDFDGTIADTLDTIVRITNRIAPEYGYSPTTPDKLRYYQSLSTKEMLKQSEIPLFRLPFLLRQVRREMTTELDAVPVAAELVPTIKALSENGHQLMIMSSNSKHNILRFLERQQIANLFSLIQGGVGLLSKARTLKQIIRREGLDFSQVIYVGDETRDIDASKQVGISIAAVTWGFSSREALAKQSPAWLIDHPRQLLGAAQTLVNPSWVREDYRGRLPIGSRPDVREVNPSS
ncbi:haloacid dehalogenase-like hydrolase, putative [Synechococcus sp. PCC 7335]|uniref:HAD hydrolase-like protein n=1 Tax=Synechococcus sp. (strain ATCC 29403 / PCC 7335) TaxID=91464 RepID=UPI00017EB829|nr:HAD hydrolase-like protein [Synechococcus sp. PCC 7335]EDX86841.1 haloacid dehalogenase-like hydrolase, putative [Synechococcus sp. PCC 7335]